MADKTKPKFWNIQKIRAEGGKGNAGRIDIYGEISETEFWGDETTPSNFIAEMTALGEVDYIDLHIFSPGGGLYAGLAIHSLITQYPKPVNCYVEGMAASIATVIMCACDKVYVSDVANTFYHDPIVDVFWTTLNAKDARKLADDLDKAREPVLLAYSKKSGKSRDEIIALLEGDDGYGTWMTAGECIEFGLADAYIPESKKPLDIAACIRPGVYNYRGHEMDFSKFNFKQPAAPADRQVAKAKYKYKTAPMANTKRSKNMGIFGFGNKKPVTGNPAAPVGRQVRNEAALTGVKCWSCNGMIYLNEATGDITPTAKAQQTSIHAYRKGTDDFMMECPHCHELNEYSKSAAPAPAPKNAAAAPQISNVMQSAVCPDCGVAVDYDTETAPRTDSGFELTCEECGAVFMEGFSDTEEPEDKIQAAYQNGIRAERQRVAELADMAAKAPGMATAINAAIRNGNQPEAVRKRVIANMGDAAKQNPQGTRYLAAVRRGTQTINGMPAGVPVGAYRADALQSQAKYEQNVFDEAMEKRQGRQPNREGQHV